MRDSELTEYLASFGWKAGGRRPGAGASTTALERVGFARHEEGRRFLDEYHGLRIDHRPTLLIAGETISSWTRFDPSAVCTARDAAVAGRCAEVAGTALFPVGVDSFHLTIYAGGDGRFYAGFDSSVHRYGDDPGTMFSMLKDGVRPVLLGTWTLPPHDRSGPGAPE